MTDTTHEHWSDYNTRPIGGGNPYYACVGCGKSEPEINGDIDGHGDGCSEVDRYHKHLAHTALQAERDAWKARATEWRNDFRALEAAIVGDTGLSAMLVATQARLFKPRAEAALARVAELEADIDKWSDLANRSGALLIKCDAERLEWKARVAELEAIRASDAQFTNTQMKRAEAAEEVSGG